MYTAPYVMLLMRANPLRGKVGGGLKIKNLDFLALNGTCLCWYACIDLRGKVRTTIEGGQETKYVVTVATARDKIKDKRRRD